MYRVILTNNGIEKIINDECDVSGTNRIKGTCKIGINIINSFTFDIYSTNPCYNDLYSLITFIDIFNTKTNEYEFRGRILIISENMDSSGRLYKKVICESDLGFFLDSTQDYEEYQNIAVKEFLEIMINRHNSKVEIEKHFKIGNVNVLDSDSTYKSLDYDKTYTLIKSKLIDVLGGEFQVRYVDNIRYLDYLIQIGSIKDTTIELAKNLQTIEKEQDSSNIVTRLTPLGNKLDGTEKRLTIESVNKGVKFIEDKEAVKKLGIINCFEIWDDITNAEDLLKKGELFLKNNNKIQKKYKINALDLKLIDLDLDSFKVGNSYPVINDLMNLNEVLRIVEKTINIELPEKSTLTFGDKFDDIKQYQLNLIDTSKIFNKKTGEINNINNALSGLNITVNNATSDIIELNTKIENIPKNYLTTDNILNVLTSNSTSDAASANTVKYLNDSKFEKEDAKKLMCKTLSNVDLNNYKDGGLYFFTTNCINSPRSYFTCNIIGNGVNDCSQSGFDITSNTFYTRTCVNKTWSAWQKYTSPAVVTAIRNRSFFNFQSAWTVYNIGISSIKNKIDANDKLVFTSQGIRINSTLIKAVKVSGLVSYNADAMSGDKLFHILKNNVANTIGTYNSGGKGWTTAVVNEQVILVVSGDVISLGFASGNTGNMEFLESALTVETVY